MSFFTEEELRNRAKEQMRVKTYGPAFDSTEKRARAILSEHRDNRQSYLSDSLRTYDIFLSHSSKDTEIVAGLKLRIEDLGYSVYVDWIDDPLLNRAHVTKETALKLQDRMKNCKSLIYAFSPNASNSKWMPWELGYFDALKKGRVSVLPIKETSYGTFKGTEYLEIYNYIQIDQILDSSKWDLWVHETSSKYVRYLPWLNGENPTQR